MSAAPEIAAHGGIECWQCNGNGRIAGCMCSEGDAGMPMFRVGKKAAGALLDGAGHRGVARRVLEHFERLAPHPKNPADFSTSPQGGGEEMGEAG